jgi:prepilin-type N-terminal cleavage/methylation domain-containing protein
MHTRVARPAFTLPEVLAALVILGIGILGLSSATTMVGQLVASSGSHTVAAAVATARLEQLASGDCENLTSGSTITRGVNETWHVASGTIAADVELTIEFTDRLARHTALRRRMEIHSSILCQ